MKISKQSDYALRFMVYVAVSPYKLSTISEIANSFGISKNHLMKIASKLVGLGLVESIRGRNGGIKLEKSPSEITLADIIGPIERDLHGSEERDPIGGSLLETCNFNQPFEQAQASYLKTLEDFTLDHFIQRKYSLQLNLGLIEDEINSADDVKKTA